MDRAQTQDALAPALTEWLRYYNENRGHSSLEGKTLRQRLQELTSLIPPQEEVESRFDLSRERWHTNWPYTRAFEEGKGFFLKRCR